MLYSSHLVGSWESLHAGGLSELARLDFREDFGIGNSIDTALVVNEATVTVADDELVSEVVFVSDKGSLRFPHVLTDVLKEILYLAFVPSAKLLEITGDTQDLAVFEFVHDSEVDVVGGLESSGDPLLSVLI